VPATATAVRRTRPGLYGTIAAISIVSAPITFGFFLVAGVLAVFLGAAVGACSRPGTRQDRAVVAVCSGLALLVGPAAYLALALIT